MRVTGKKRWGGARGKEAELPAALTRPPAPVGARGYAVRAGARQSPCSLPRRQPAHPPTFRQRVARASMEPIAILRAALCSLSCLSHEEYQSELAKWPHKYLPPLSQTPWKPKQVTLSNKPFLACFITSVMCWRICT